MQVIEAAEHESSSKVSNLLDAFQVVDGVCISLSAIVKCLEQICHVQRALECVSSPTTTQVLPMIEQIKKSLSFIQLGIQRSDSQTAISSTVQALANHTITAMEGIKMHDLWVVACLIHPSLRSLSFFNDISLRNDAKTKVLNLLRTMVENVSKTKQTSSTSTTQDMVLT